MLGNCSKESSVKLSFLKQLKVPSIEAWPSVSGVNQHSVIAICCLEVTNIKEKNEAWIKWPQVFAQDYLPVASDKIATTENIQKWEDLRNVVPKMKIFEDQDA